MREGLSERVRGVAGYEEGGVGGDVGEDGGEGVLRGGEGVGEVVDGGGAGGGGEVGVCCLRGDLVSGRGSSGVGMEGRDIGGCEEGGLRC